MSALATADDLKARLGRDLTPVESARADALLADASALVRAYTGQDFSQSTSTDVLRGRGGTIILPQQPAVDVTAVVAVGGDGIPDLPLVDWFWDGLDTIRLGPGNFVINLPESWINDWDGYPGTFRVTYSHGYAEVPPDVLAVVCGMALRTLTAPSMTGGVTSETIGDYSYRLGAGANNTAASLTADDRGMLDRYRLRATTLQVRQP